MPSIPAPSLGAPVPRWHVRALFAAIAALLLVSMVTRPIDHDEGQYVAATSLMRGGWPFVDFAYLQMPLQPLLLGPLSQLPAGALFAASRLANATFAFATLILLWRALRGHAPWSAALAAVAALACTDVFLFAAGVARNDALPMALLAGGMALLLQAQAPPSGRYAAAGLLLGLAAAAKISFAFPAAAAGLFLLREVRLDGWRPVLLVAAGGMVALLPAAALAIAAPEQFRFGVLTYSLEAPRQWWSLVGEQHRFTPGARLEALASYASKGAILPAILVSILDRRRSRARSLLHWMTVGGLIAAYLPEPAFRQYLSPVLVPLFARLALALGERSGRYRSAALALVAAAAVYGLAPTVRNSARAMRAGPELALAIAQGRSVARLADGGRVVTLSPERVAGSDVALDPAFATGAFLFRTQGLLAERAFELWRTPNWALAGRYLSRRPPAVIVTGGEREPRPPLHANGLDSYLEQWALANGYRSKVQDRLGYRIYVRPGHSARPSGTKGALTPPASNQRE